MLIENSGNYQVFSNALYKPINQINQTIEISLGKQKCVEPIDAT